MTDDSDAKARETAHGLIQGYIVPDLKVIDMIERLYSVEHLHDGSTRSHRVS